MSEAGTQVVESYLLATLSAVFNGSFAACAKFTARPVDPILFTFYNSLGVLLSSFSIVPLLPFLAELPDDSLYHSGSDHVSISYLGIIAGSLYVIAIVFSFAAVHYIGLGVGQGVWGGAAILVSFLWGVLALGDTVKSVGIAVLSLIILILGVVGIAINHVVADVMFSRNESARNCCKKDETALLISKESSNQEEEELEVGLEASLESRKESSSGQSFILGMICALLVGVFGGSILVPMSFVDDDLSGLAFLPSFGLGGVIASTIITVAYYTFVKKMNPFTDGNTFTTGGLFWGMLSGIIWNGGNICSIFAITGIGYATAYPILQCALFFGGLWGIFVFREVTDKQDITVFFLSAVVLFAGAVILSINTNV